MKIHLLCLRASRVRLEDGALAGQPYLVMPLVSLPAGAGRSDAAYNKFEVLTLTFEHSQALALIARVRQLSVDVGIVVTQAGPAGEAVCSVYDAGADACFAQALQPTEVQALLKALTRRLFVGRPRPLQDALHLDARDLLLVGPAGSKALTVLEARLLSAFVSAPQQSLSYERLLSSVEANAESRSRLNMMIFRLRHKLRQVGAGQRCITAVRGWGYQLCSELHTT